MAPREQSRDILPGFITESSARLEEHFPLIIINSRKKSFTGEAGSICPSVFPHLPPQRRDTPPYNAGTLSSLRARTGC